MRRRSWISICLTALLILSLTGCGRQENPKNLITQERGNERVVNLFSPMEKTDPNAENVARAASDLTVAMAEEQLGVSVEYLTYTAETYQEKTYDDVCLDRVRNNMDDIYRAATRCCK